VNDMAAEGVVDQHETHNCAEQVAGCEGHHHRVEERRTAQVEAAKQAAAQGTSAPTAV
jgi:hypothetical protein